VGRRKGEEGREAGDELVEREKTVLDDELRERGDQLGLSRRRKREGEVLTNYEDYADPLGWNITAARGKGKGEGSAQPSLDFDDSPPPLLLPSHFSSPFVP